MTQLLLNPNSYSAVEEYPAEMSTAIAGTHSEGKRESGIFTNSDLLDIKKYVKAGLALPHTLDVVESYLGYKKVNIPGLEPEDIMVLY